MDLPLILVGVCSFCVISLVVVFFILRGGLSLAFGLINRITGNNAAAILPMLQNTGQEDDFLPNSPNRRGGRATLGAQSASAPIVSFEEALARRQQDQQPSGFSGQSAPPAFGAQSAPPTGYNSPYASQPPQGQFGQPPQPQGYNSPYASQPPQGQFGQPQQPQGYNSPYASQPPQGQFGQPQQPNFYTGGQVSSAPRPSLSRGVPYQPPQYGQPQPPPYGQQPPQYPPPPQGIPRPASGNDLASSRLEDRYNQRRRSDDNYEVYDDGDLGGLL
jgi:hypothetical protein